MKAQNPRKPPRTQNPIGRLDLRIEFSQEEILADLLYPAPVRRARRS
jgi:hypothetical protein